MRLFRIVLPIVIAAALAACAANAGTSAAAEPAATVAGSGVTLLNERAALNAMQLSYPQLLRDARVTGTAHVVVTLDAAGRVSETNLRSSTHHLFEPAAHRVAENLLFSPPAAAGQRVAIRMDFAPRGGGSHDGRAGISIVD